jgi:hypothetical protein
VGQLVGLLLQLVQPMVLPLLSARPTGQLLQPVVLPPAADVRLLARAAHFGERWCLANHVQRLHRPLLPPARRALRCCRQVDAIPPPPVAVLVEAAASCAPVALNGAERAETSPWAALRSADAPPVWEVACDRVRTPDGALRLSAFRFFEAMLVEGVDPGCSTGAP